MKPENTITFLAELLEVTAQLRELVKHYCREITAEAEDGCQLEKRYQDDHKPF